jgi:hypothetical protein
VPAQLLILGNPNKKTMGKFRFLGRTFRARSVQAARKRALQFMKLSGKGRINPAELVVLGGNPHRARRNGRVEDLYEGFQGREPEELIEYDEPQDMPRKTAVLGDLVALGFDNRTKAGEKLDGDALATKWDKCSHISFAGDDVKLASNGGRTQLYLVGGNQELDASTIRSLGGSGSRIGPVYFVVYNTRKEQDNFEGGQYTHEFAEEGGRRPTAYYDAENERILLRGGSYVIEDRGIVN